LASDHTFSFSDVCIAWVISFFLFPSVIGNYLVAMATGSFEEKKETWLSVCMADELTRI
jgi:hypothetical protein